MVDTSSYPAVAGVPENDAYEAGFDEAIKLFHDDEIGAVVDVCERLINQDRGRPEAFAILGLVAYISDDFGRSIQMFETCHDLDPDCRDFAEFLATLYARVGRLTDGVYFAKLATALDENPRFSGLIPSSMRDFASALKYAGKSIYHLQAQRAFEERDYKEAAEHSRRHLQIERDDEQSFRLLARCCIINGDYDEAVSALHAAIHINSGEPLNYMYLGHALNGLGRPLEALSCFERGRSLAPNDHEVYALAMTGMISTPDDSWPRFRQFNTQWNRKHVTPRSKRPGHKFDPVEGRRVRIGYIGGGFNFESSDAYFVSAAIGAHDRTRFELFGYQTFSVEDALTHKMQNTCDEWVNLQDVDAYTASLIIENDQCDILIDCTGYQDDSRIDVLARRAAPVQISWTTHGEGANVPGADYLVSDGVLFEVDSKMCLKDQQPLVVEQGSMALAPFSMVSEVGQAPAKENGVITFGAKADLAAASDTCIGAWSKVLEAVPGSRIAFGAVDNISSAVKDRIIELFAHMGMANRVVFHEPDEELESGPGISDTLQDFFSLVDVFLDSNPKSSPLLIAQSLWMGVPVVTIDQGRRSARMGASVLTSARLSNWVAKDDDEFVEITSSLVSDVEKLNGLRASLRSDVEKSPLFNPTSLARRLEDAFLTVLHK